MLALLHQEFVNCWVLAKDLEAIAARDGSSDVATLCKRIRENYAYPVDSVLVAADLRVVGHANVDEVGADPTAYLTFLRKGLAAAGRALTATTAESRPASAGAASRPRELTVTRERPSTSLLDLIHCRGFGQTSLAYYSIDASAFADGGVLEIDVRVGRSPMAATFELCAAVETPADGGAAGKARRFMGPVQSKTIASESTGKLVHPFEKGERFGLAVKPGSGSSEGDSNAFLAGVTVRLR